MKKFIFLIAAILPLFVNGQVYKIGEIDAYSKTELQTSGQASVNFNNVFGVPDSLELASQAHETVSRTIYVATTGDDDTGTGAIGAPFLTIGKALSTINKIIDSGVTVTISIGIGTFTLSAADLVVLNSILGSGTLKLQGTLTLVDSGFTMGSAQELDPLTYAVSGGTTASWTTNQWSFYFLKSGSSYYPITHNTSTTLSLTGGFTGTQIYQTQTIINLPTSSQFKNLMLAFSRLSVNLGSTTFIAFYGCSFGSSECYFYSSTTANATWVSYGDIISQLNSRNCYLGIKLNFGLTSINYSYFKANNSNNSILSLNGDQINAAANLVFEVSNTGSSAAAIYSNRITTVAVNGILKLVNCNVGFMSEGIKTGYTILADKLVLVNTNYLFSKTASSTDYSPNLKTKFNTILGSPVIRWFKDDMYEFINLPNERSIQLIGILYPEFEQGQSATITNNATTNVQIGDSVQNNSIVIDYTATRGDSIQYGQLTVVNKMAKGLVLTQSTPVGSNAGLTFTVSYITPHKINLAIAATNTVAGTFQYNATRKMRVPLTL